MIARMRTTTRDDAGITVTEMLATVFLLGIVMTMVLGFVTSSSRTLTRDRAATDNTRVVSTAMAELTRVVRAGTSLSVPSGRSPAFIQAHDDTVTMYAYVDAEPDAPRPLMVRFSVDGDGRLVQTRWRATNDEEPWQFRSTPDTTRVVAHNVVRAERLFTYRDANGDRLVPGHSGLDLGQRENVAAVEVTATVQSDPTGRANPVTLTNTVSIPNLGVSRVEPSS